jgi:hypothetical protein
LCEEIEMFLHAPACFEQAVLNGVPDAGEAFEVWCVEAEEIGFGGRLDYQGLG